VKRDGFVVWQRKSITLHRSNGSNGGTAAAIPARPSRLRPARPQRQTCSAAGTRPPAPLDARHGSQLAPAEPRPNTAHPSGKLNWVLDKNHRSRNHVDRHGRPRPRPRPGHGGNGDGERGPGLL